MKVLVINPGSTSTKLAIYQNETKLVQENLEHDAAEIAKFDTIADQAPFRAAIIDEFLKEQNIEYSDLATVVGRGGLVKGLHAGGYIVNEDLAEALADEKYTSPHASALGGLLAKSIADKAGVPAYIYDAVTGGDLEEISTVTGFAEYNRASACHLLNSHAMGIKYAESIGKEYKDLNLIIAHIGGGVSISAHSQGKLIDSVGDDELHMSPERSGGLPLLVFLDMCYSGEYTKAEMKKKIRGQGGMYSHLGTSDCRKIEEMISNGDEKAKLVYEALAMQIGKSIGLLSVVQKGKTDAIILTGGAAHSKMLTENIKQYVEFLAPVEVLAGENEMEALALGGLRLLNGEETAQVFSK